MKRSIVDLLLQLIAINSKSRNEKRLTDFIIRELNSIGISAIIDETDKIIGGNSGNIFATVEGSNKQIPTILLNAHLDTVNTGDGKDIKVDIEKITRNGEFPFGADDKVGIAVILESLKRIKDDDSKHGDIEILFTVAEEIGLLGAKHFNYTKSRANIAYILDSHGKAGQIVRAAPTQKSLNFKFKGRAAHAGVEPEKGHNSILAASKAISQMKIGRIDKETTANIGKINGGQARNIVPELTTVQGEVRSHDNTKLSKLIDEMVAISEKEAKKHKCEIEIEIIDEYQGYKWESGNEVIKRAVSAAKKTGIKPELTITGGGSDTNIFNAKGLQSVAISVGYENPHSASEIVYIAEMEKAVDWLTMILTQV